MKRIMVIDDEQNVRTGLKTLLEDDGYEVLTAENGKRGIELIETGIFLDLVISDLRMPGVDGMELLKYLKQRKPGIPLILITAYASIERAVEAMKKGAADFISKPFDTDVIRHMVCKILKSEELKKENVSIKEGSGLQGLVFRSRSMQAIMATVRKVASVPAAVLILGESGTGKEMIAKAIHALNAEQRRSEFSVPFVNISCPTVPDDLLESELFGYMKGAFTGACRDFCGRISRAANGILFLDEIAEMPVRAQAKLLRFIEEKIYEPLGSTIKIKVDTRILCASNRDLEALVREGRFREDLYYRINTITIRIPPLRERKEDILPLARHFLEHYSFSLGKKMEGFSEKARQALLSYTWPGNVRELRNIIERAVVLSDSELLRAVHLPPEMEALPRSSGTATGENKFEQLEKRLVSEALRRHEGNVSAAARELGVSRDTLRYRMKKYRMRAG